MVSKEDALEENGIPGGIKLTFWKFFESGKDNLGKRIRVQIQDTPAVIPAAPLAIRIPFLGDSQCNCV